jgi:hypothetical protein
MAKIAHDLCPTVELSGLTISGGANVGAEATLPAIIGKLLNVKISAALRGDGARWEGVLQKDLVKARSDSLGCSQAVYTHMFDAFYLSDMATLKPISRPAYPAENYRSRIAAAGPSAPTTIKTFTTNAPNSFSAETINGNVLFEAAKEHRAKYLEMLQDIYVRGSNLLARVSHGRPKDDDVKSMTLDYVDWVNGSAIQIKTAMTPAAVSSFMSVTPPDAGASVIFDPPLDPPLSIAYRNNFTVMWYTIPKYLENTKYLMEHDTMDPQNAGN